MGVAGSGKSTLGAALALALRCEFQEGDELHPAGNLRKMSRGRPLTEADRKPWLAAVAAWLEARRAADEGGVVTCSALRRVHRDRLRRADPDVRLVLLQATPAVLEHRLNSRAGHIFPASLLQSQLDVFEPLLAGEDVMVVDATLPTDLAVTFITSALSDAAPG